MWHYLFVQDASKAAALTEKLPESFFQLQLTHPNRDAAVFSRLDKKTGEAHFYFSPGTELLAAANGAAQCDKPSVKDRGGLLVGDEIRIARLYG